jgi:hypothetical protein
LVVALNRLHEIDVNVKLGSLTSYRNFRASKKGPARELPEPSYYQQKDRRRNFGSDFASPKIEMLVGIANPHPVPTPSRWHPLPATAVADADSSGEDWEVVPEVMKAMEVIKMREVVSRHPAMIEGMYASPSAGHAKVTCAAEVVAAAKAVHAAEVVAPNHRVGGQRHWRGKHRHHDCTSDCYFAEHDNPPDCHKSPRAIVRTQCKIFK